MNIVGQVARHLQKDQIMSTLTQKHTSFASFAELLEACKGGYVPSFILSAGPKDARAERAKLAAAVKLAGYKVFTY